MTHLVQSEAPHDQAPPGGLGTSANPAVLTVAVAASAAVDIAAVDTDSTAAVAAPAWALMVAAGHALAAPPDVPCPAATMEQARASR